MDGSQDKASSRTRQVRQGDRCPSHLLLPRQEAGAARHGIEDGGQGLGRRERVDAGAEALLLLFLMSSLVVVLLCGSEWVRWKGRI